MLNSARSGKGRSGKKLLIKYLTGGRLTRGQAIKAHCYDCDGMGQTGKCDIETCSLYPFSPYRALKNRGSGKKTAIASLILCLSLIIPTIACTDALGMDIAIKLGLASYSKAGDSKYVGNNLL